MYTKKKVHWAVVFIGLLIAGSLLSGCRSTAIPDEVKRNPVERGPINGAQPEGNISAALVPVYYLDAANQRMVAEGYNIQVFLKEETIRSLYRFLLYKPTGEGLTPAIDPDTALLSVEFRNNILYLNVSQSFYQSADLVAARVALVNTYTSLEGIDYVHIFVEGKELTYDGTEDGLPIGPVGSYGDDLNQVRAQDQEKLLEAGQIVERALYFRDVRGQYFMPEVRSIHLDDRPMPVLLTEALTQGPLDTKGLYPVLPGNIQVLNCEMDGTQARLYMSRSFVETQAGTGQLEQSDLSIRVASLVLTVTSLSDVESVKFFYEDGKGGFTDEPMGGIYFNWPMRAEDFEAQIGRRIVVYFSDSQSAGLVPEYRAVARDNRAIEHEVLSELLIGPLQSQNKAVIPVQLKQMGIGVALERNNTVAVVNISPEFDASTLNNTQQRLLIYSIVNSLTDPINLPTVTQVRFTVGGETVETFGGLDISQPLTRNPSLILQ